jgi:serine/threonine protein kinase
MLASPQLATLHNYTIDSLLGEGSYGQVYAAEETSTHTSYAVKILPRNLSTQSESEINILSALSHQSCIHLHEVLCDETACYLVTEHVSNGTLLQHMNHSTAFTEQGARQIFAQLFDGIRYLHEVHKIAHLDLKLENVMIDSNSQVKIIDFGQAQSFEALARIRGPVHCGSPPYRAPEIVNGSRVTPNADIWSMGIILYALVTGSLPFFAANNSLLTARILFDKVVFPGDVSPEFRDLVSQMLEKESAKRITLAGIAAHAWMNEKAGKEFKLPRLDFLHHPVSLKRAGKLQQIEQGLRRLITERQTICARRVPRVKMPVRPLSA